jgi:hypothetical protein
MVADVQIELALGEGTLQGTRRGALPEVGLEDGRQGQPARDALAGMARPRRARVGRRLSQAIASSISSGRTGTRGKASAMTSGIRARAAAAPTSIA